jgi:hypothetical protein
VCRSNREERARLLDFYRDSAWPSVACMPRRRAARCSTQTRSSLAGGGCGAEGLARRDEAAQQQGT